MILEAARVLVSLAGLTLSVCALGVAVSLITLSTESSVRDRIGAAEGTRR